MLKELLSSVHPGAAVGVSTTPSYKHVGHDSGTETITGYLLCLLLSYRLPRPWFCSTPLLSRRVKNLYFPLFWLHWLQGHTVRPTGKGMAFPSCRLANKRFAFSSFWKSLRTQKTERKHFNLSFTSFSSHKHDETRLWARPFSLCVNQLLWSNASSWHYYFCCHYLYDWSTRRSQVRRESAVLDTVQTKISWKCLLQVFASWLEKRNHTRGKQAARRRREVAAQSHSAEQWHSRE